MHADSTAYPKLVESPFGAIRSDTSAQYLLEKAKDVLSANPRLARRFSDKALKIAEEKNDTANIFTAWHTKGIIEFYAGNYTKSLEFYLKALRAGEEMHDTSAMSRTSNNIGILLEKSGNPDAAKNYYFKALKLYESSGDNDGVAAALNNLGNIYQSLDSLNLALDYYNRVEKIRSELGDSLYLAYCYGNIGNLYVRKKAYETAEKYYHKGQAIFEKLNDTAALARSYMNMAVVTLERKQYKKAGRLLHTGLDYANLVNDQSLIALYYQTFADMYAAQGEHKKAYDWRMKYETANSSYLNQENMRQINEMQIKYETASKARQIELLKKEQELKEIRIQQQSEQLRRSRTQFIILVVIIVLLLISAYLLIRSYRLSQRAQLHKEKLRHQEDQLRTIIHTQEAERNRFARDLHDGLGQYLTALKMSILNFESRQKLSDADRNSLFDKIMTQFNDIYLELRHISFNIMPQVLLQKGLIPAMEELTRKLNESGNIHVDLFAYGVSKRLNSDQEIAVYRIIQELINNAIRHSHSNAMTITFTEHAAEYNIMLETNGKGFDTTTLHRKKGNGWKNILSRLEMLGGHIETDSSPMSNNSTFIIDIPFVYEQQAHITG